MRKGFPYYALRPSINRYSLWKIARTRSYPKSLKKSFSPIPIYRFNLRFFLQSPSLLHHQWLSALKHQHHPFSLILNRIDWILWRSKLAPHLTLARIWIHKGYVSLNGHTEKSNLLLHPGDSISLKHHPEILHSLKLTAATIQTTQSNFPYRLKWYRKRFFPFLPAWFSLISDDLFVQFKYLKVTLVSPSNPILPKPLSYPYIF